MPVYNPIPPIGRQLRPTWSLLVCNSLTPEGREKNQLEDERPGENEHRRCIQVWIDLEVFRAQKIARRGT